MVTFPNCKINLGLNIIQKREDGYHDLETVFYPVLLRDALEVMRGQGIRAGVQSTNANVKDTRHNIQDTRYKVQDTRGGNHQPSTVSSPLSGVDFYATGLEINGAATSNLCVKAYHLLQKDFPDLPSVKMHLHKVIPMGAGLGGGSADGAFALKLLNHKFQLNLSQQQLIGYALRLGSDCPFFILNKPCFATGRGEIMTEIALDLSAYKFVIVNPNIHISTGWAFGNITPQTPQWPIQKTIQQPLESWKKNLVNDFEKPAIDQYPTIGHIKQEMYSQGAVYASMTGSGSTVFGIFKKEQQVGVFLPKEYFVFEAVG